MAERVLLPDDPGCALRVAQALMAETPRMLNHNRGLWGYVGPGADGAPLTVQSSGLGGPAAAIVVEELVALGVQRIVRVGLCRALSDAIAPGTVVVADPVHARDGTSAALGAPGVLRPDAALVAPVLAAGARAVPAISTDRFYGPPPAGADVWDLESAAVLAAAAAHRVPAAAVLAVAPNDADVDTQHELELLAARAAATAFGL